MDDNAKGERTNVDTDKNELEITYVNEGTAKHKKKKKKERKDDLTELSSSGVGQKLEGTGTECQTFDAYQNVLEITENLPSKACEDPVDTDKNELEITYVNEGTAKHKKKKERKDDLTVLSSSGIEQKLEGTGTECQTLDLHQNVLEITENLPSKACEDSEEATNHKKKEKKEKPESTEASKNSETASMEKVNLDDNEDISKHLPTTSCEVTKKEERQHESDSSFENVEQKTGSKKVELETRKEMQSSSCEVTQESGCDVSVENVEQKTVTVKIEINAEKNDPGASKDMPITSIELTEEPANLTNKKHESDVSVEKVEQKTDGEKIEINEENKDVGMSKDMPIPSIEIAEQPVNRTKNKNKNECDVSVENMEQKTDSEKREKLDVGKNESEIRKVMSTSDCGVTEKSDHHKKKKKEKKRKYESDVSAENVEQKTDSVKIEINVEKNDSETSKDMPITSIEITEEPANRKKTEKENKNECDVSVKNMEEKTDDEKMDKVDVSKNESEIGKVMSASTCEVSEESKHHKKKKKEKKRKRESDVTVENVEQKTDGEEMAKVDVDKNESEIGKAMSTSSCEVTEKSSDHHKKKKKEKKRKHESDVSPENVEQKTDSVKIEINVEKNDAETSKDMPITSIEITEEPANRNKTEKENKNECDVSVKNMEERTDGDKMDKIDVGKNESEIGKVMSANTCEVTEESKHHKKKKKEKKRKRESDVTVENVEQKTDGKEIEKVDVDKNESEIGKVISTSSCKVAEESHKKKKKEKRRERESDVTVENVEQKTDGEKIEKVDVDKNESEIGKVMSASSCKVAVESHKKKKKEKKRERESDVTVENVEHKSDGEKMEKVGVGKNESEIRKVMSASSCEVTEESDHKKKKKEKRRKRESDVTVEKVEQKTDGEKMEKVDDDINETEIRKVMSASNCEVVEEPDHKKKKKEKKRKHASDVTVEDVEQKTDGEKMEKVDVDKNKSEVTKVMSTSICEVTEESHHHKKKKKDKKRKHESDVMVESVKEKTDSVKMEINEEQNKVVTSKDMSAMSVEIRQESANLTKKKHESDISVENVEQKTDGEKMEKVDVNKSEITKVMSTSSCEVTEESHHHKKKKKDRKRKHESNVSVENVEEKTDSVKMEVNEEKNEVVTSTDMPTKGSEITEEWANGTKKKRKHDNEGSVENVGQKTNSGKIDINTEENVAGTNNEMPISKCEVTEDSGHKKKKKKKDKKRKHEIDLSCDNVEQNTDREKEEVDVEKTEVGTSKDVETSNCELIQDSSHKKRKKKKRSKHENNSSAEVDAHRIESDQGEKESKHEETSKTFGNSEKSDLKENKEADDKVGGNQWASAEFGSVEKKEKFLRLMGAFKPSSGKPEEKSNYSAMAMNMKEENAFVKSLEKQYSQSKQMGKGKVGLGYH